MCVVHRTEPEVAAINLNTPLRTHATSKQEILSQFFKLEVLRRLARLLPYVE